MTAEQRRLVIAALNGRDKIKAFEAAKAIWEDSDPALELGLIRTLKSGSNPFNRAAAAFAMQMVTTSRTIAALERTVKNRLEAPKVRGEAAEALAHAHRKTSHDVLLKNLNDPSKDVRFWCAFSLGQMREKRAISQLRKLVSSDKRNVRGFHSVSKEAADAIQEIESNGKRCVFCVWK